MRDAGIHELATRDLEAGPAIKTDCVRLRAEHDLRIAARLRHRDECCKYRASDTFAPMDSQHRHPPDVSVRQQASGAYRIPMVIEREHVPTCRVGLVPFQFLGNVLLDDEYLVTDTPEPVGGIRPCHFFDAMVDRGIHSHGL